MIRFIDISKRFKIGEEMRSGILSAIEFLTIIPCPGSRPYDPRAALPYYPVAGLAIGLAVVIIDALGAMLWPKQMVAMLDIIALAIISGALHLDGLADTADGLYSHRDSDQALAIMKDSRIGAMGSVALVCCLGLKWVAVANIESHLYIYLWIVPAYARASVLLGTRFLPYGRESGGIGHGLFTHPLKAFDFRYMAILVILSLFTAGRFFLLNAGFLIIAFGVILWYRRKMNCITGDMLGALIEVTETGLFLIAAMQ